MPEKNPEEHLKLPVNVVSRTDVGRLVREVEELDEFLKQSAIREPGTQPKLPKTSRMLDEFLSTNQLNALHEDDRHRLYMFLQTIKERAPVLHMSFAADPSPRFQQQLMSWLRVNVDSIVLVQIGLQPNIGAGLVMRTTNKYFDLSLREFFKTKRSLLLEKIHGSDEEVAREEEEIIKSQALLEQEKPAQAETAAQPSAPPVEQAATTEPKAHEEPATNPVSHEAPAVTPISVSAPAVQPATAPETPAAEAAAPVPPSAPPAPLPSAPAAENPPTPPATTTPPAPQAAAPQPALPPQNYQPPKPLVGEHSGGPK